MRVLSGLLVAVIIPSMACAEPSSLDSADGSKKGVVYVAKDGKVGIGTQAPDSNLHIRNTSGNSRVLIESKTSVLTQGGSAAQIQLRTTSAIPILKPGQKATERTVSKSASIGFESNNLLIDVANESQVIIRSNGKELMKISPDGIVSIPRGGVKFPDGTVQTTKILKGDTGATGPQGLPGPKGVKGDTGPQGQKGDSASIWCAGVNGGSCSCGSSTLISRQDSRADMVTTVLVTLPGGQTCSGSTVQQGVGASAKYWAGSACLCETK